MDYDSMGVKVTTSILYDKLVINNNLSYEIYTDGIDSPIEDGTITIIAQTSIDTKSLTQCILTSIDDFYGKSM